MRNQIRPLPSLSMLVPALLLTTSVFSWAEFARLTETYAEHPVVSSHGLPPTLPPPASAQGSFRAQLTIPGLARVGLAPSTVLALQVDHLGFQATVAEANRSTSNSVTFYLTNPWADPGTGERTGQITFTFQGNVLDVSASNRGWGLTDEAAHDSIYGPGRFSDQLPLTVSVGDLTVSRTLYCQALGTARKAKNRWFDYSLARVVVVGMVDTTAPQVRILTPKSGAAPSNTLTVGVKASDLHGIAGTFISVNNPDKATFDAATLNSATGLWEVQETLVPGMNTLRAYAVDVAGNSSPIALIRVTR